MKSFELDRKWDDSFKQKAAELTPALIEFERDIDGLRNIRRRVLDKIDRERADLDPVYSGIASRAAQAIIYAAHQVERIDSVLSWACHCYARDENRIQILRGDQTNIRPLDWPPV